jgi:hypothetical protein
VKQTVKSNSHATRFEWIFGQSISSVDLLEILNSMPMLETFDFVCVESDVKINLIDKNAKKFKPALNLTHLKSIHIISDSPGSFYRFLTTYLPEDQLEEHSLIYIDVYDQRIELKPFQAFLNNQKSIIKFKTDSTSALKLINNLNLDELEIKNEFCEIIDRVLQYQPNLKSLKISSSFYEFNIEWNVFYFIEKMSNLEVLKIPIAEPDNLLKLKNLKKLRELDIDVEGCEKSEFDKYFNLFNFERLDKLSLRGVVIDIPENFDKFLTLKSLHVETSQKLNFVAKKLVNLEELSVRFWYRFFYSELDTGIVNRNVKKLEIEVGAINEEFWMIFDIFPSLENLKVILQSNDSRFITKNFFEKLNTLKTLKSLEFDAFSLNKCKNDLKEIASELKKLSNALERVKMTFQEYHYDDLFYKALIEEIKNDFVAKRDPREGSLEIVSKNE